MEDKNANSLEYKIWQAKIDLAAILRTFARLGLNEGVDNHFSCLVPGKKSIFNQPSQATLARSFGK
jgi:ribulose-5-phosphate 4-epimerase/fuculose-1-phosphate aldolase